MMLSWQRSFEMIFLVCIVVDMAKTCDKDAHCKPHQVCCGKRCRSWPKCFLNNDKDCYYDTHCIKGEVCVSSVCKPRKLLATSCKTNEDCDKRNISSPHDRDVSHVKCCQGKCLDMKNCLQLLKINSTLTTPTTSRSIRGPSLETVNYTSVLECMDGKCKETKMVDHSENTEKSEISDSTLLSYKRGILLAVILIGLVFLTLICYYCLRETKYAQKYCCSRGQGDDTAISNSSCSHQVGNLSTVLPLDSMHAFTCRNNNRFSRASWMLFPGLYGLSQTSTIDGVEERNREHEQDCTSSCTRRPPSYRSVCFDQELPPSYDQTMNCDHCQNHPLYNIPEALHRTGINI